MNKTELVAAMAEKAGLSKKDAEAALKAFTDAFATLSLTKTRPASQASLATVRRLIKRDTFRYLSNLIIYLLTFS